MSVRTALWWHRLRETPYGCCATHGLLRQPASPTASSRAYSRYSSTRAVSGFPVRESGREKYDQPNIHLRGTCIIPSFIILTFSATLPNALTINARQKFVRITAFVWLYSMSAHHVVMRNTITRDAVACAVPPITPYTARRRAECRIATQGAACELRAADEDQRWRQGLQPPGRVGRRRSVPRRAARRAGA